MRTVPVTTDKDNKPKMMGSILITKEQEGWVLLWGTEKAHYIRGGKSLCLSRSYTGIVFHTDTVKPKCMRCQRLKRKET